MAEPVLSVRDLRVRFDVQERRFVAVDGVSFELEAGKTLALVGESGCGKSVTALAILGLLPDVARVESGSIRLGDRELVGLSDRELRSVRGKQIAMVFQEPMTALNPVLTVGDQIAEAVRAHGGVSKADAKSRAIALLAEVGIPDPERRYGAYPHELSGGMRQRVVIAMALAGEPRVLLADEPTTALDVTIQAQVLELFESLKKERATSVVLITHDLGVVAGFVDEVCVLYAGRLVERCATHQLFEGPLHPYTAGLLRSLPSYGGNVQKRRLPTIPGVVPELSALPGGCRFAPRCERADERCHAEEPPLAGRAGRFVACHHPLEGGGELP
ncbi:MAG: ABC transporter ATP-binding protein [Polyangiales bacterium]